MDWPGPLPWAGSPGKGLDVTPTAKTIPTTASGKERLCLWVPYLYSLVDLVTGGDGTLGSLFFCFSFSFYFRGFPFYCTTPGFVFRLTEVFVGRFFFIHLQSIIKVLNLLCWQIKRARLTFFRNVIRKYYVT